MQVKAENIVVLTSAKSWFVPYAERFAAELGTRGYNAQLLTDHTEIPGTTHIVFILSYFRIIPSVHLGKNRLNLVVHESDLPKGKGWAPMFWQVLEGKNEIPVTLFEADEHTDNGRIWFKDVIQLRGDELHDELRHLQAEKSVEMCLKFLEELDGIEPKEQEGESTFYPRRTPKDSELDTSKSIDELFNQLRIASNEDYPAFFMKNGVKYVLQISAETSNNEE